MSTIVLIKTEIQFWTKKMVFNQQFHGSKLTTNWLHYVARFLAVHLKTQYALKANSATD